MENKPVNLCKVTLTVSRIPKEVVFDVSKTIGSERVNTWHITHMEAGNDKQMGKIMCKIMPKPLVITKSNLYQVNPYFAQDETVCSTWCFPEELERAKDACLEKMEEIVHNRIARAAEMSAVFQEYKSKVGK